MLGDQDPAPTGLDGLRAGYADREHAIKALKQAFVQGRLTGDEFGPRAGQALSARTYGELTAVTRDIPDVPDMPAVAVAADPPGPPSWARNRPLAKAVAASGGCLLIASAAVLTARSIENPLSVAIPLLLTMAVIAVGAALVILACGITVSAEQRRTPV